MQGSSSFSAVVPNVLSSVVGGFNPLSGVIGGAAPYD